MVNEDPPGSCPVCSSGNPALFHRDHRREYLRCENCGLVFVPPRYFLSPEAEKACYELHQNNHDDPNYRRFLDRLAQPLIERLTPGSRGLDFGSGPGPTLSLMLANAGYPTAIYDPFYEPNAAVWQDEYDFITASEVVEHLHRPMYDLQRIWAVLKPGGWLGIMTKRVLNATAFSKWHYKDDPTHVVFFSEETFIWLAKRWTAELRFVGNDVAFLKKPDLDSIESSAVLTQWQRQSV
jgi:SAM-dependent methyltransferase